MHNPEFHVSPTLYVIPSNIQTVKKKKDNYRNFKAQLSFTLNTRSSGFCLFSYNSCGGFSRCWFGGCYHRGCCHIHVFCTTETTCTQATNIKFCMLNFSQLPGAFLSVFPSTLHIASVSLQSSAQVSSPAIHVHLLQSLIQQLSLSYQVKFNKIIKCVDKGKCLTIFTMYSLPLYTHFVFVQPVWYSTHLFVSESL